MEVHLAKTFSVTSGFNINPFTAMLAAPSLGKLPITVPNLKLLRPLCPLRLRHVKAFLSKCTVLKLDLLHDHQMYGLEVCMRALFSPVILQAGAVKGLKTDYPHP